MRRLTLGLLVLALSGCLGDGAAPVPEQLRFTEVAATPAQPAAGEGMAITVRILGGSRPQYQCNGIAVPAWEGGGLSWGDQLNRGEDGLYRCRVRSDHIAGRPASVAFFFTSYEAGRWVVSPMVQFPFGGAPTGESAPMNPLAIDAAAPRATFRLSDVPAPGQEMRFQVFWWRFAADGQWSGFDSAEPVALGGGAYAADLGAPKSGGGWVRNDGTDFLTLAFASSATRGGAVATTEVAMRGYGRCADGGCLVATG